MRPGGVSALVLSALVAAACGVDSDRSTPGLRGPCGSAGGPLSECEGTPIVSAEDACWRLVECGAIPVANPEDDPGCCFDWARCVDYVEELPDLDFEVALTCIEHAPCDHLTAGGSPDRTNGRPPCLEQGDD